MTKDAKQCSAALVAVDWGTTSFRAWLLDAAGTVLDKVRSSDGSLRVSERANSSLERAAAFQGTLQQLCSGWLAADPGLPVLCAGMVGSNHGWMEVEYLDVPVPLTDLANHLTLVGAGGANVRICPGLRVAGPDPDVIRGEEVQLVGALADSPHRLETVVLPGTHSKWVRLDGLRVTDFTTAMTGELYGLLMQHSILARLATSEAGSEASDAFVRALEVEAEHGDQRGLPFLLFTARTLVLAGRLDPADIADYVSGLLIGAEVRHALLSNPPGLVAVCGSGSTVARYRIALERSGATVTTIGEDVAAAGLWRIAANAGLLASS
ncbi:MAG: 2-dehydro-3-deoxygalactonokinase [Micropruina sp.]|uniref:2-dehydro-3-deoxygalactonokinase n=1 Tax=Micropruina sp. TaxID=2737536 RepID=UPI0039E3AA45